MTVNKIKLEVVINIQGVFNKNKGPEVEKNLFKSMDTLQQYDHLFSAIDDSDEEDENNYPNDIMIFEKTISKILIKKESNFI